MTAAPRIAIDAARGARAQHLVTAYPDMTHDPVRLAGTIEKLRPSHPAELIAEWLALAQLGDFAQLANSLMQHHYDPRYDKHRARGEIAAQVYGADALDSAGLADLATRIAGDITAK
jgi:tRNA 2-selenouridine synthase